MKNSKQYFMCAVLCLLAGFAFAQPGLVVENGDVHLLNNTGGYVWIGDAPSGNHLSISQASVQSRNGTDVETLFLNPCMSGGQRATVALGYSFNDVVHQMLDVNGAIRLGNTTTNTAGSIKWTGSDFQGHNGTSWKSLTGGNVWTVNGNDIYAGNAGQVGIGTMTPEQALHVKDGNVFISDGQLQISNGSGNGKSTITSVANGLSVRGNGNINLLTEGKKDVVIKSDSVGTFAFFEGAKGFTGLGSTAPDARLHVVSESGDDALRIQTDGGATQLRVMSNGAVAIGANWNGGGANQVRIEGDVIRLDDVIKITPRSTFPITTHEDGMMFYHSGNNKLYLRANGYWVTLN